MNHSERFQLVPIDEFHPDNSFLSENVKKLFQNIFQIDNSILKNSCQFIDKNDLTLLKQPLNEFEKINFNHLFENENSVKIIQKFLFGIDHEFRCLLKDTDSIEIIKLKIDINLDWLGSLWKSYIIDAIDIGFKQTINCDNIDMLPEQIIYLNEILSLYLLTSGLEHCLGDLLRTKINQIPPLMKDLIEVEELGLLIGEDLISALKIILGPPTTLNIRNILWHGFINCPVMKNSYLTRPLILLKPLISTLVALITTIGKRILEFKLEIPRASMFDLNEFDQQFFTSKLNFNDINYFIQIIKQCPIIHRTMRPIWIYLCLNYLNDESRYSRYFICFLFPIFEASMRYLYCQLNHLEDRLLTAIVQEYYVTFKEIFCSVITELDYWKIDESNASLKNLIQYNLPVYFLHIFNDLLIWYKGPRLRDRLSHGQIKFDTLNENVRNFSLVTILTLIEWIHWKFVIRNECKNSIFERFSNYETQFHSIYFLRNKLIKILEKKMKFFQNFKITNTEINFYIERLKCINHNVAVGFLFQCSNVINFLENFIEKYWLFLNYLESFWLEKTLQSKQLLLRSRQRGNFQLFENSVEIFSQLLMDKSWLEMLVNILKYIGLISKYDKNWQQNIWDKNIKRLLLKNMANLPQKTLKHQWKSVIQILSLNRAISIQFNEEIKMILLKTENTI